MNLTVIIESAEFKFKQILENFFVSVYNDESLPSHGLDHHRRVWSYAKELIISLEEHNNNIDITLPENLIIACYLHDIGMSVDSGTKHGHHSKDLCRKFLKEHHLDENNYQILLSAIENHDNKEYKTLSGKYDLLTILSIADDMDAFGFIGIYRYSEIYLKRGINFQVLGSVILKNAKQRYDNLINTFGTIESIANKQSEQYNILNDFFNNYNLQLLSYNFDYQTPAGYCGVIMLINDMIQSKISLTELIDSISKYSDDPVIILFFEELREESVHHFTRTQNITKE